MCFTNFPPKISQELLKTMLNFILNFFSLGILSQKSSAWFPSCTVQYILQECYNFTFSYLYMEPESRLIFKNISSVANLNSLSKFEFTNQNLLDIKLLRKGIQEKLYFNNIVSIKSTFLGNSVV